MHFGAYFHDRESRRSFFQLKNTLLRVGRGEPRFIRRLDHFEEYNYDNLFVSLFIPLLCEKKDGQIDPKTQMKDVEYFQT